MKKGSRVTHIPTGRTGQISLIGSRGKTAAINWNDDPVMHEGRMLRQVKIKRWVPLSDLKQDPVTALGELVEDEGKA